VAVTATTCISGKRHRWDFVATQELSWREDYEFSWCKTCGSMTEFIRRVGERKRRCTNEDGSLYIVVPTVLSTADASEDIASPHPTEPRSSSQS
jgi:hypothetical protein